MQKMDVGLWKGFFMWSAMAAGVYVVIAGALATYLQSRLDEKKESDYRSGLDEKLKESKEQLETLRSASLQQATQLQSQVGSLESKLDPFLELARKRFPDLSAEEALRRLRTELAEVRELASRDIPRDPSPDVAAAAVSALGEWHQRFPSASVRLNLGNADTPSAEAVFNAVMQLIQHARISHEYHSRSGVTGGRAAPITLSHPPGLKPAAESLVRALGTYVVGRTAFQEDGTMPANTFALTLCGVPRFRANGVVTLE